MLRPKPLSALAILSAALLGQGAALAAHSQPAAPTPSAVAEPLQIAHLPRGPKDPTNAALLYNRIWLDPAFADFARACGDALQSGDPAWYPDAALVKQLEDHAGIIAMLMRATQAPDADFGIEWSQGIGALLPHLGKMRASSRILACDARRCIAQGKLDDGAARIAAIVRLARHCSHDQVLISALVSAAVHSLAISNTESLMKSAKLTVEGKHLILTELRATSALPDPFGVKRGIAGERYWTCDWLRTFCTGPEAGQKLVRQIIPLTEQEGLEEEIRSVAPMNEQAIAAELDACARCYDDIFAAWNEPDAQSRLKQITSRLEAGDYGVIARILVPAMGRSHQADLKGRAQLAGAIQQLESHVALQK